MNSEARHIDEAKQTAIEQIRNFLSEKDGHWQVVLIEDLFARLRIVLWAPEEMWTSANNELDTRLSKYCGPYWSKSILCGSEIFDDTCKDAIPDEYDTRLKILVRYRKNLSWFKKTMPPWPVDDGSYIMAYYSFNNDNAKVEDLVKTATQLAKKGERVVVIDANFVSPGLGLFSQDSPDFKYGVADYLLERKVLEESKSGLPKLLDYYFKWIGDKQEEIFVFPAGAINERYLEKISRLDSEEYSFDGLFKHIRAELKPNWILINSESGFNEFSGSLLNGLCHFYTFVPPLLEHTESKLQVVLNKLMVSNSN